jgi:hypothetical protein
MDSITKKLKISTRRTNGKDAQHFRSRHDNTSIGKRQPGTTSYFLGILQQNAMAAMDHR